MICKFCKGTMRPLTPPARILLCDNCGYFETDKMAFIATIYGAPEYPPQCTANRPSQLSTIESNR